MGEGCRGRGDAWQVQSHFQICIHFGIKWRTEDPTERTSPPVRFDSAEPVPRERFKALKVHCDLPKSYSSQQCVT